MSDNKISLIDSDTNIEIEEPNVADYINDFFTNIGPNLARNLNEPWSYNGIMSNTLLPDVIISQEEIVKFCKEIKIHKSSSIEGLSSRILKDVFLLYVDKLKFIFDQILDTGNFPIDWKCATIIPLKKVANTNSVTDLLPISLLPLPSKIFEKLIHSRIIDHLESNKYLDKNQGGFRKNNSTIGTTVNFTNHIFNAIDNRKVTLATFIDMAKAFDTVNHKILVKKLEYLGISGKMLKLLKNYLENRKQSTLANGITSKSVRVTCGIPQGSTIGPLMYIIYMNDVYTSLKCCKYKLYADDTVLYMSGEIDCITNQLCDDLKSFKTWCDKNKLTLNVKKTKYITFGLKSQTRKITNHIVTIGNIRVERVHSYKYLGITLDLNMNFKKHMENCIKYATYKTFLLSKVRKYITTAAAIRVYKTMILPLIDYGDILYDGTNSFLLKKIQTLQNRCLRICQYKNYHITVKNLHELCTVSMLKERRIMHLKLFMFKQKSNKEIVNTRLVHTRAHDALLFTTIRPKSEKYKINVYYQGTLIWNAMNVHERSIETYTELKCYLKKQEV